MTTCKHSPLGLHSVATEELPSTRTSSGIDVRLPFLDIQLGDIVAWLEQVYVDRYGRLPGTCLLQLDWQDLDRFMMPLRAPRLLLDRFTSRFEPERRTWQPGLWELSGEERFRHVLLFLGTQVRHSHGRVDAVALAAGPEGELRALAEWCKARAEERLLPPRKLSWNDIVLPAPLLQGLREEVEDFLASEWLYRDRNLPWKKGLLLTGDPGNGKTMAIRIIASLYGFQIRLFVKPEDLSDFSNEKYSRPEGEDGRSLLIFEDLDRMLSEVAGGAAANRLSQFLNAVDGYCEVDGRLIIATANRADCLDPAIRSRPSRFDRIFLFPAPDLDCRRRYLDRLLADTSWETPMLAAATAGFSMAFLKELGLLCLQLQQRGEPVSETAAKALVARLKRHMTLGKKRIGMR